MQFISVLSLSLQMKNYTVSKKLGPFCVFNKRTTLYSTNLILTMVPNTNYTWKYLVTSSSLDEQTRDINQNMLLDAYRLCRSTPPQHHRHG